MGEQTTDHASPVGRIFYGYYLSAFTFALGFIGGAIYLYSRGVFVRDQIIDFDASRTEISLVFTTVAGCQRLVCACPWLSPGPLPHSQGYDCGRDFGGNGVLRCSLKCRTCGNSPPWRRCYSVSAWA